VSGPHLPARGKDLHPTEAEREDDLRGGAQEMPSTRQATPLTAASSGSPAVSTGLRKTIKNCSDQP